MKHSLTRLELSERLKRAKDLEQTLTRILGAKEAFNLAVYKILQDLDDD